jgi:hypothetical protein
MAFRMPFQVSGSAAFRGADVEGTEEDDEEDASGLAFCG